MEVHGGFPRQEGTLDPDNTNNLMVAPLPDALRIPAPSVVLRALCASVVNTAAIPGRVPPTPDESSAPQAPPPRPS
jgi:hypothetical protein